MAGEGVQQKAALEQAQKTSLAEELWPRDKFGSPMLRISAAAAELVPTVQFGNATVGPVQVIGFVPDGPDDQVKSGIKRLQRLCEEAVAEDRQTLHEQIRARAGA
jgi:hypothetical protein